MTRSGTRLRTTCTASSVKPNIGSEDQTCRGCFRSACDTRETISNGLRLIRIRYRIPGSELPDLEPKELSKYLSYLLLQGKKRAAVVFPRKQSLRRDSDGFLPLMRMLKNERWEFAHSVSSIKRSLPKGCSQHTPSARPAWEQNAFSTPPPPSSDYLRFVRSEVSKLFPYDWDRDYDDFVWRHVPNASARMNSPRADLHWCGNGKEFRRQCLTGRSVPIDQPVRARYKEVMSAGKCRPLVIYDETTEVLAPLHKCLDSHLMRMPWRLVGPPTEKKISSACVYPCQTSVDLVSATDNLSLDVTEAILGSLLRKSRIPGPIRLRAFQSLRPLVDCAGEEKEVSHGQMMGSYLSFPLLCLHSYLAARWALRGEEGNVLVNGDDTLVSSHRFLEASDYPSGYLLNDLKTIRSGTVAEINSTGFLRGRGGKWREIRNLRRGGFQTDYAGMQHAAKAVSGSVAWTDAFIRSRIGKKWGFLPSQLRLHPKSYVAFERSRSMWNRNYTCLPEAPNVPSTLLLGVRRRLDPDEQVALFLHQWATGREGGKKRDVFNPSVGSVRRTYAYRAVKPWSRLTFLGKLAALKVEPARREEELRFLPVDYVSMREDVVLKELAAYGSSVFEND
ncbi:RNA-dependent RNA polymerase [Erysiphe necator associated ourmia-like virus 110]|nr:RNA-dependent RNA polymerase [Erysiphe necator associated ourmia-like virus 110]